MLNFRVFTQPRPQADPDNSDSILSGQVPFNPTGSHSNTEHSPITEIRKEEPKDQDSVRSVNMAAFENGPEAALVDELRVSCEDYLAFVAVEDGIVVGHILFTPGNC